MSAWYCRDEVNAVAALLDGPSLARLSMACVDVHRVLRSEPLLKWLSAARQNLGVSFSSLQQIDIAETMARLESTILCKWGSVRLEEQSRPLLESVAKLLARHPTLELSIEGHCGLEARGHLLLSQAWSYTHQRAEAVRQALIEAAPAGNIEDRLSVAAYGYTRPLHWAFDAGYGPSGFCNSVLSAKNRRVELYLTTPDGFEVPRRRPVAEYARPPGVHPAGEQVEQLAHLAAAHFFQDQLEAFRLQQGDHHHLHPDTDESVSIDDDDDDDESDDET